MGPEANNISVINNGQSSYFGTSIVKLPFAAVFNVHVPGWLELDANTSTSFIPLINGTHVVK